MVLITIYLKGGDIAITKGIQLNKNAYQMLAQMISLGINPLNTLTILTRLFPIVNIYLIQRRNKL